MKFIVIEGIDGSGKSTQIKLLQNYLQEKNIDYKFLHFPRTDQSVFGELVAMFLRGEFGNNTQVNPYLVALIYAGDRNDAKGEINNWLKNKQLVIVDRYVYSNIAFQCAKLKSKKDREKLAGWILNLEYKYFSIPQPDINIFLDVPLSFTKLKLTHERAGADRNYLKGAVDIHEQDIDFQMKVRDVYLEQVGKDINFKHVDCARGDTILPPNEIFTKIIKLLHNQKIVID